MAQAEMPGEKTGAPSLTALFLCFAKVACTSFGGGLSGWMLQEIVRRKRWVGEEEFLNGLAIAQALPGVNVVNLPIWLGYKLRGGWGAVVSATAMVVPPMLIIIAIAASYESVQRYPQTGLALAGAAASAIGMALATRNLMDQLRSAGAVTGGPPPFGPRDRSAFLSALDLAIVRLERAGFGAG
jgi:chromate transporter